MKRMEFSDILKELEQVRDHGSYVSALCCFHPDKNPSMLVWKDGWFKCLSCGAKGNYEQLHRKLQGWTVPVVQDRTDWHSPLLPTNLYEQEELCNEAHAILMRHEDPLGWYLKERKVFGRVLPQHLGYWNGWYTIPIINQRQDFMGMVARAGRHIQQTTGCRFTMPKGQGALLYIPDHHRVESNDYIVAVYGMIDALSLCELGIPVCTGSSGKDSLNADMLDTYRKRVIILPDKGEEDTARKLRDELGWRGAVMNLDYPSGCKDPNDLLVKGHGQWLISEIERIGG